MKFAARVFAALLACSAVAELRVWRPETQQSGPHSHVREQDCTVIGWAELCESQNLLTAGSCFQLQPGSVPRCQLQGPQRNGAAAQLRPASDHVTTLQTTGELHIAGHIQMTSLRFEAETLSFEDAEVDAWHEVPSDLREPIEFGGAFYARNGSFTLTRSNLTVRDTGAVNGGGFAVAGDLRVGEDSHIFIENVSAKKDAGGFFVTGNAKIYENSLIFVHNARAEQSGGGFKIVEQLQVKDSSIVSLENVNAATSGGSFVAEEVVIAGRSTLNITNSRAESGLGGGFYGGSTLIVSSSSTLVICYATAGSFGGGFMAYGDVVIAGKASVSISNAKAGARGGGFEVDGRLHVNDSSTVSIENVTATEAGGGFAAFKGVVIAGRSTLNITNSRSESRNGGGFYSSKSVTVSSSSTVVICNATAGTHGGGFYASGKVAITSSEVRIQHARAIEYGGGFTAFSDVVIAEKANVSISNAKAGTQGGGFDINGRVHVNNSSTVSLENVTAGTSGGGFIALEELVIADCSTLKITNSRAESGLGGGFYSQSNFTVSSSSTLVICNATAGMYGGGFFAIGDLNFAGKANVSISNARAGKQGGGFQVDGRLHVNDSSTVSIEEVNSEETGGGFAAFKGVVIAGRSTLNITNSRSESGMGGGFYTEKIFTLSSSSTLVMCNATAVRGGGFLAVGKVAISSSAVRIQHARAIEFGGGFYASGDVVIAGKANVSISNARAGAHGGGFEVDGKLHVNDSSTVSIEHVTAGAGGGFVAFKEVVIAGRSTLNITNSCAESGDGGGFNSQSKLTLSTGSTLLICNATGKSGGGFWAAGKVAISSSTARIEHASARQDGGGFASEDQVELVNGSRVVLSNSSSGADGGGFLVKGLLLHGSELFIKKSTGLQSGAGGRVDGQALLEASNLVVQGAEGPKDSSVLAASCLHLREQSNILLEGVVGGHGMDLQNADCKKNRGVCHSTFEVAQGATLNARSGRLASGLLSVAGCPAEKIHLSGIYLQAWSSPLLSTQGKPGHVVVDQVRIDYEAPVNNLPVLAVEDGYTIDSMMVSCGDCADGLTFDAAKDGKHLALSLESLRCPKTVTVSNGSTTRCECGNYQITHPDFRHKDSVLLEDTLQTCMFCEPHSYFENGACQKCGLFSAWSDGGKDVCHTWPLEQTQRMLLFLGAAAVVLMIFIAWEIIKAPLIIIEAKSTTADEEKDKRTFTFSVQGPIVDLHKSLAGLVHRRISYRVQGTDLFWLDYDQNSQKVVKVSTLVGRNLILENLVVPFDCGACKGALKATDVAFPFIVLTALITLAVMLPIVIKIAVISGNELEHIAVTAILAILPMAAVAPLFHVPVAWLLRRLYSRTPFWEALGNYEKRIQCKPYKGPDVDHPYNHGLQAATLHGFWRHFEGFILAYNMHFVVANIVRPLTNSKQISFVTLWGGRQVDYFVSHSWITGFRHFVDSIHRHALSKEGPAWRNAAYWICSFANNQWNIEAELGSDIMSSAFARVLTAGPKQVAMVLDQEVQPLTRVWCLFEFLLANRHQVDLVFVTDDGVVGTDGCSSFDIALEMGKKIESLQVAKCNASSEQDKKDIFAYIVSELGSLERMDEQIRSLMGDMLVNNLTNVGRATEDLLKKLGQKKTLSYQSSTVETLSSLESSQPPDP